MSTYVGPSANLVEQSLEKMRHMLKKRGADGIQGLARNFRICDTNGSGQLDEEELAKVSGSLGAWEEFAGLAVKLPTVSASTCMLL